MLHSYYYYANVEDPDDQKEEELAVWESIRNFLQEFTHYKTFN